MSWHVRIKLLVLIYLSEECWYIYLSREKLLQTEIELPYFIQPSYILSKNNKHTQ